MPAQYRPTIHISPLYGGTYTRMHISTCVPTPLPLTALRRLCNLVTLFSGHPVRFVLHADVQAGLWCEWWVAQIADLPARHANMRLMPASRSPNHGD